jgi:hypothetical protein
MDNTALTEKLIDIACAVARIEENTTCIPKLKDDFESICEQVHKNTEFRIKVEPEIEDMHKNTEFRKNYTASVLWYKRTTIGALICSLVAVIIALVTK